MDSLWARGRLVVFGLAGGLHDGLEGDLAGVSGLGLGGMGLKGVQEVGDALHQAIVDDALVLERLDLVLALQSLLVNLVLLCADE